VQGLRAYLVVNRKAGRIDGRMGGRAPFGGLSPHGLHRLLQRFTNGDVAETDALVGSGAASALLEELRRPRPGLTRIETDDLAELERFTTDLARAPASSADAVVVFAGGDGTYMSGMSALARAFSPRPLPRVAFAPGGTVSTIAKNWGMWRRQPVGYTRRLLDAIATGDVAAVSRPTLRVRSLGLRGETVDERIGFIVGSGLVARFFGVYGEHGAGGRAVAARIVARVFAGSFVGAPFARRVLDPMACTVTVDGAPTSLSRVSLVCASVVPNLGLGMRLLYRAGERRDRFHVVATPLPPPLLGPQLPLVLAGRPLLGPGVDTLARSLELVFPAGTGAFVLDGELVQADAIEVTVGPSFDLVGLPAPGSSRARPR
jgi:diacylglycerol kinase (ATP)